MACSIICSLCGEIVLTCEDNIDYVRYMCTHHVHEECFYYYDTVHHRICPACGLISWTLFFGFLVLVYIIKSFFFDDNL